MTAPRHKPPCPQALPSSSVGPLRGVIPPATEYARADALPALLGLWPSEVEDYSIAGTEALIARLRKALRAERRRGQAGEWTYDVNRHMRLLKALKRETEFLETISRIKCAADRTAGFRPGADGEKPRPPHRAMPQG